MRHRIRCAADSRCLVRAAQLVAVACALFAVGCGGDAERPKGGGATAGYEWTPDHMQVGVRWQPFPSRPGNNTYDATRPVITEDSSYAQFWVSWAAAEPAKLNTDYAGQMSPYLKAIEAAVDACIAQGLKVEFVFWHTPAWASESGESGGRKPKRNYYKAFVQRIAKHFKGRVHAYQLYHEVNTRYHMWDGDIDYIVSEHFIKGAKAIRAVYGARPAEPVILSTSGCSPCEECPVMPGLEGQGGEAVSAFYDLQIANPKLMKLVDGLNLNVSDQNDGYGVMDGSYVTSAWGNYDLARQKLDASGRYRGKAVMAAESWISWDDSPNTIDVNGDGLKNELDAYHKTLTIMGQCLQRGLNTMNLPWSDNESDWAMGLTKRRDYNGRIKQLRPELVIPADDGGADIVTEKVALHGADDSFSIGEGLGTNFTVKAYINPPDPNHLHYYIWKWYAQIAGGPDEVIRHAVAGEVGNDIRLRGPGFTGTERYRIASYNRTKERFTVLIYSAGANGESWATLRLPSVIQTGYHYNNEFSRIDFRGEGFPDGTAYQVRVETKDISPVDGSDLNVVVTEFPGRVVSNQTLAVHTDSLNRFTTVEFRKAMP